MTPRKALSVAVSMFGSECALARAIDWSADAFNRARRLGKPTPAMCKNIEILTDRQVTRLMLRPDIFGDDGKLVKNEWRSRPRRARRKQQ